MKKAITILILGITLIFTGLTNLISDLENTVSELRWDYISHKKIEECRGLSGQMEYEGGSDCYTKDTIYQWEDEAWHWRVYKTENFEDYEIFRMKLND